MIDYGDYVAGEIWIFGKHLLEGVNMLPEPIQGIITQQLFDENKISTTTHGGAIRKVFSTNSVNEPEKANEELDLAFKRPTSLNFDVHDWELAPPETSNFSNSTIKNLNTSEADRFKHEMNEIRKARLELKNEHEKLREMKASMSVSSHNIIPQSYSLPIYTKPPKYTATSSIPTSSYQFPYMAPIQASMPYSQPYQASSMNNFSSYSQSSMPLSFPNSQGFQSTSSFVHNLHQQPSAPIPTSDNQNRFPYNIPGNDCRKTFLKHLDSIPIFTGDTRERLMNFIEICDILDKYAINDAENEEFLLKITLQLRGEARSAINLNDIDWLSTRENLLKQFHYLSNRDILNSKIENLKQERNETLIQYSDRTRKLLTEKIDHMINSQRIKKWNMTA